MPLFLRGSANAVRIQRGPAPDHELTDGTVGTAKQFLLRDSGGRCGYSMIHERECGTETIEVDHFDPRTVDGKKNHSYNNLLPAYGPCNRSKSNKWPTIRRIKMLAVDGILANLQGLFVQRLGFGELASPLLENGQGVNALMLTAVTSFWSPCDCLVGRPIARPLESLLYTYLLLSRFNHGFPCELMMKGPARFTALANPCSFRSLTSQSR